MSLVGRTPLLTLAAVLTAACVAVPAHAAPPPNDHPAQAAAFEAYAPHNGMPDERQAVAELAEATRDRGVPRCLGRGSFARTVWYRVPEAAEPREVTVEAMGRTLDVVDLAAFVQPQVPLPPPENPPPPEEPPPDEPVDPVGQSAQSGPLTREANACAGAGAGGSDAAEEPTSAVSLRVPAGHPVLVQVGRRGSPGAPEDERAVLSLASTPLLDWGAPPGDRADGATPLARVRRANRIELSDATITEEDPAQPACPSLSTVWRRFEPGRSGKRLIRVAGPHAQSLTVFAGRRPTGRNAMDCVNRAGRGALEMVVRAKRSRPVWIRVGADGPPDGARASLRVLDGSRATVIDGGPGGFDPTTGGPGGGLPEACAGARADRARIAGPRLRGAAGARNRVTRVPVELVVRRSRICDVELELRGPRGHVYAKGRVGHLLGRATVALPRLRTFRSGAYRLRVTALDRLGRRVPVRGSVRGRLG